MIRNESDRLLSKINQEKEKRRHIERKGVRGVEPNLKAVSDALDEYFTLNKLQVFSAYLSYAGMANEDAIGYKKEDFLFVEDVIRENQDFDNPCIRLYFLIITLYQKSSHPIEALRLLHDIEQILVGFKRDIPPVQRLDIYALLANYAIKNVNQNREVFRKLLLGYNNQIISIKYGELKYEEPLQPGIFKNMVVIALGFEHSEKAFFNQITTYGIKPINPKLGFRNAFEWAEKFINFYGEKLDASFNIYAIYCKAYFRFKSKEYVKALSILENTLWARGTFINLDVKMLHLMVSYEVQWSKPEELHKRNIDLFKIIQAYSSLIKDDVYRKKQLDYQIGIHKSFLSLYKKLYQFCLKFGGRIYNNRDQQFLLAQSKLEEEIQLVEYPYKNWLLEKVKEIK